MTWSATKQKFEDITAPLPNQVVLILLVIFVAFKALFIAPRFSDGNIYLYLGYLIRQGAIPYKDFFYSSPPLLPYIAAGWGSIFGFTWQSFGWIPIVATVAEALLLFTISKKISSTWAAVISVAMYLGSFAVLASTDFFTDIHVVALFCLASVYVLLNKRPGWAGLFMALACLTKVYAGVFVLGLLLWHVWQKKWVAAMWFTGVFIAIFGGINLVWWLVIGHDYIQSVVLNNLHRGVGIPKWRLWKFFLQHDVVLMLGLLPGIWFWRRISSLLLIPIVVLTVFFVLYPDIYYLYFKLLAAWLALWFGWSSWQLSQRWPATRSHRWPSKWLAGSLVVVVVAGIGIANWFYLTQQSQMAVITNFEVVTQYVRDTTSVEQSIYGDFSITPLIARLANRPIANNLVDTNVKFFNQNIFSYAQYTQVLQQARVPLVMTLAYINPQNQIALTGGSVNEEMLKPCHIGRIFPITRDYESNAIIVWQCSY